MGFGEMAAMMYLHKMAERDQLNASDMRDRYNDLVVHYNNLLEDRDRLKNRETELVDSCNVRAEVVTKLDKECSGYYHERNALVTEVEDLKKQLASRQAFIGRQEEWIDKAIVNSEKDSKSILAQNKIISDLTGQNVSLEREKGQMKEELRQRMYVGETIRRGMHHIPVEFRIKAAADSYVRHPDVSQAVNSAGMSDEMKADIEMYVGLAMFPESGDQRKEIETLYKQAKEVVNEEVAKSRKVFEELIEIRNTLIQQAKDNGEDPGSVPDIWTIQAEMKQKKESETKSTTQEEDEEETCRPGM